MTRCAGHAPADCPIELVKYPLPLEKGVLYTAQALISTNFCVLQSRYESSTGSSVAGGRRATEDIAEASHTDRPPPAHSLSNAAAAAAHRTEPSMRSSHFASDSQGTSDLDDAEHAVAAVRAERVLREGSNGSRHRAETAASSEAMAGPGIGGGSGSVSLASASSATSQRTSSSGRRRRSLDGTLPRSWFDLSTSMYVDVPVQLGRRECIRTSLLTPLWTQLCNQTNSPSYWYRYRQGTLATSGATSRVAF